MFQLQSLSISGYRSLNAIHMPAEPLSVFVGANGSGKTNLYRALQLVQAAAAGTLAQDLAAEGGFHSAFWAGPRKRGEPVRIRLATVLSEAALGETLEYSVQLGLPEPVAAPAFPLEAQVKAERLSRRNRRGSRVLLRRDGPHATIRTEQGDEIRSEVDLLSSETALAALQEVTAASDIHATRRALLHWRFYHDLRTDSASPLRQPCLPVTSPTLASDGSDLAAVFATLAHIRQDTADLDAALDQAFPGASLVIPVPERTASFGLVLPDYPKRVFEASELSDGTLRYLGLMGALLSYRLPPFIALNEPEASLHPSLLEPLADLIVKASDRAQIWLVTHSEPLAEALARRSGRTPRRVVKDKGATWIEGLRLTGAFADEAD